MHRHTVRANSLDGRVIKNALRLALVLVIAEARDEDRKEVGGVKKTQPGTKRRLAQEALVDAINMCLEFNNELTLATTAHQLETKRVRCARARLCVSQGVTADVLRSSGAGLALAAV